MLSTTAHESLFCSGYPPDSERGAPYCPKRPPVRSDQYPRLPYEAHGLSDPSPPKRYSPSSSSRPALKKIHPRQASLSRDSGISRWRSFSPEKSHPARERSIPPHPSFLRFPPFCPCFRCRPQSVPKRRLFPRKVPVRYSFLHFSQSLPAISSSRSLLKQRKKHGRTSYPSTLSCPNTRSFAFSLYTINSPCCS